MSGTAIPPDGTKSFPASVTGPADGDLANAASVNGAFASLITVANSAQLGLYGAKLRPSYRVAIGSNTTTPMMTVDPLGSIVLTSGGLWYVYQNLVVNTINLKVDAHGAASFALKTRYYLYAYLSSGSLAWLASTDTPSADFRYKSGGTDYAYVGTFLTDPSVVDTVWPCVEAGGVHYLPTSGGTGGGTQFYTLLLSESGAVALTAFPVYTATVNSVASVPLLPSYVKVGRFLLYVNCTGTGIAAAGLVENGVDQASSSTIVDIRTTDTPNSHHAFAFDMPLLSANLYRTVAAGNDLTLYCTGWVDPR